MSKYSRGEVRERTSDNKYRRNVRTNKTYEENIDAYHARTMARLAEIEKYFDDMLAEDDNKK